MPPELHGISAKLHRADANIQHINSLINEFIRQNRNSYRVSKGFDAEGTRYVFKAAGEVPMDLRIPVFAGETVHHLRSVFDHLVVALVRKNGKRPHRGNYFPVAHSREKFEKAINDGYIRGVSDAARADIERVQPYHHSIPQDTVLAAVHYLDIVDKHRLLLTVTCGATMDDLITTNPRQPVTFTGLSAPRLVPLTNEEQEVFYIDILPAHADFDADMKLALRVTFEKIGTVEHLGVVEMLTRLSEGTKQLISEFVPHFQ